eukprot:1051677-Prorocentrum_minimum.AAC.1
MTVKARVSGVNVESFDVERGSRGGLEGFGGGVRRDLSRGGGQSRHPVLRRAAPTPSATAAIGSGPSPEGADLR